MPATEKFDAAQDFLQNAILVLLVLVLPFVLFPKLALIILFSSEFVIASQALFIFLIWQCLYQIVNVYQQLMIGLDDVMFYSITTSLGFMLVIGLSAIFIPLYGLVGAALSLLSGVVLTGLTTVYRLTAKYNFHIQIGVWVRVTICVLSIVCTNFIFVNIDELTLYGFLARFLYALMYLGCLWFLLNKKQKCFVLSLRQKLPF